MSPAVAAAVMATPPLPTVSRYMLPDAVRFAVVTFKSIALPVAPIAVAPVTVNLDATTSATLSSEGPEKAPDDVTERFCPVAVIVPVSVTGPPRIVMWSSEPTVLTAVVKSVAATVIRPEPEALPMVSESTLVSFKAPISSADIAKLPEPPANPIV